MNKTVKVGIVIAGYILSCAAAYVATYINELTTQGADAQASQGMFAFGQGILFMLVFGGWRRFPCIGILIVGFIVLAVIAPSRRPRMLLLASAGLEASGDWIRAPCTWQEYLHPELTSWACLVFSCRERQERFVAGEPLVKRMVTYNKNLRRIRVFASFIG